MRYSSMLVTTVIVGSAMILYASSGCGGSKLSSGFGNGSGSGSFGGSGSGSLGGSGSGSYGLGSGTMPGAMRDAAPIPVCPTGLQCDVSCSGGGTTTITGKVYDPAGKNPLYNVAVYVPALPLQPLPKGVPTGGDACACGALFKSGAVVSTATGVDGSFTLSNVPVGSSVPLVIQVGKWRKVYHLPVTSCQNNPQAMLAFPSTIAAGNTDDSIPDIAVSTGGADTLECLMLRIGLASTEYVAGGGSSGHVHIFAGGNPANSPTGNGGVGGAPEDPPMPGAPESDTNLWSTQAQLMPYDIVLLSCEGDETYNANPPVLEKYLNAGGRVFSSHYHYAWFAGPLEGGQSYAAPADWSNLATWALDQSLDQGPIGGIIDQTLNGSTNPFPKGVALQKWLSGVGALGQGGVPGTELSIFSPRYNATVGATNTPSQPWITSDSSGQQGATMYFSFDTPVMTAPPPPDSTGPTYCGRAVFSDLHVDGDPSTNDTSPPPGGCDATALSPQEKALEFMLFDLSSCVIPDTMAPPDGGVPPNTPQ
jgi:hypothetical protein